MCAVPGTFYNRARSATPKSAAQHCKVAIGNFSLPSALRPHPFRKTRIDFAVLQSHFRETTDQLCSTVELESSRFKSALHDDAAFSLNYKFTQQHSRGQSVAQIGSVQRDKTPFAKKPRGSAVLQSHFQKSGIYRAVRQGRSRQGSKRLCCAADSPLPQQKVIVQCDKTISYDFLFDSALLLNQFQKSKRARVRLQNFSAKCRIDVVARRRRCDGNRHASCSATQCCAMLTWKIQ